MGPETGCGGVSTIGRLPSRLNIIALTASEGSTRQPFIGCYAQVTAILKSCFITVQTAGVLKSADVCLKPEISPCELKCNDQFRVPEASNLVRQLEHKHVLVREPAKSSREASLFLRSRPGELGREHSWEFSEYLKASGFVRLLIGRTSSSLSSFNSLFSNKICHGILVKNEVGCLE